jgi:aminoglycoside 6-adenylyltransferase
VADRPAEQPASVTIATDEAAVLSRIGRWARGDDRVRAALLTGSRANPAAPRDVLSDYDVALVATEPESFADDAWIDDVGEPLVRVRDVESVDGLAVHHCMVICADWAKIDFSFWPTALIGRVRDAGRLPDEFAGGYRILFDKDGFTATWPEPAGATWITARPTERQFHDLAQEFWFVATYVAKYLWRNELLTARVIFDHELKYLIVRRMLDWRVGAANDWTVPSGFFGRGLQRRLDAATWAALMATYVGSDPAANWAALFATTDLFRRVATELADGLGFAYPHAVDERLAAYLRAIRDLGPHPSQQPNQQPNQQP